MNISLGNFGKVLTLRWLLAVACMVSASASWGQAGYVHEMTGTVNVQRGAGPATPVRPGDTFDPGTTFDTAGDGRVVIKFADGQLATLGANTTFRVDQYNFNPKNLSQSNTSISLLKGAMRYVTGLIGANNRNAVRVTAQTATIGIRGTDVIIQINPLTNAILALVNQGLVELQSAQGFTPISVTQFAVVTPGQTPTQAASSNQLPAASLALATVLNTQPLPANTPVSVPATARAVAAAFVATNLQRQLAANPDNPGLKVQVQKANQEAAAAFATAVNEANNIIQGLPAGTIPAAPAATAPGSAAVTITGTGVTVTCTGSPC